MKIGVLLVYLLLFASVLQAQETIGRPWTGNRGVSRTTDDIMRAERASAALPGPKPNRFSIEREVDRRHLPQNPASANVSSVPERASVTKQEPIAPYSPQVIGTPFLGATLAETGSFPPDCMGAVGPTQYIVAVNGRIRSFDKSTGIADGVMNFDPDVFFSSVMTPGTNLTSDPRIRYDRMTGKWIIIMIDVPGGLGRRSNRVLLAVSNTSTITLSTVWTFFFFQNNLVSTTTGGQFADYPTLGVDNNALYIGCNIFDTTSAGNFKGTDAFVVRKTSVTGAGPIVVTAFRNLTGTTVGAGPYTPQGVDNFDAAATTGYFIGVDNASFGTLTIRRVSNPGATPTLSANIFVTVPSTFYPRNVPHLGNTNASAGDLDAIDDRLFMAEMTNGTLWTVHNIGIDNTGTAANPPSRDGTRWYEIQNIDTTPTLRQSGTVFDASAPNDTTKRNYWMPSVMQSGQGHVALGFSVAGLNEHANAGTVGRLSGDALGTMQSPVLYTASSTAYNPPSDPGGAGGRRWGDYSYTSLDPNDNMTLWTIQEFCDATNSYGVEIVKLIAPPPATPSSVSPASVATGASHVSVTLTGTSSSGSGFYDPGAAFTNRLAASVGGAGVTVNSATYTDPTHITLDLSVAGGAAAGARTVTVTNPDGQAVTSGSGILTVTASGCPAIALAPASLPGGAFGVAYSQTVTASGGTAPYAYAVTIGSLPAGWSLSSGGALTGTPAIGGTFNFTVTATDSNACTGNIAYSLTIACPTIIVTPASLPGGIVGVAYSQTVSASGGTSPYTFAVTVGTLPAGLALSSGGAITGTPTATGSSSFTITATDAGGCTGTLATSITVSAPSISLTTLGAAYAQSFNSLANSGTSSTVPFGWLFSESGSNANTTYTAGTGSSTTGDTYSFGAASDTDRCFGSLQSGTLVSTIGASFINNTGSTVTSLAITYTGEEWRLGTRNRLDTMKFQIGVGATSLTSGTYVGQSSLNFITPDTVGPAGALNGNLAANRTVLSATVGGLSIANGTGFFVRWLDANATSSDDGLGVDDFSLTPLATETPTNPSIQSAGAAPAIVYPGNTTLLTVRVRPGTNPASSAIATTANLTAIGGSASQSLLDNGTGGDVTPGDSIYSFNATVGIATAPGLKSLGVSVADGELRSATASINLTVASCPAIVLTPSVLPGGTTGSAYLQTVSTTDGVPPYSYSVTLGSLPAGLNLSASGVLSGSPTAAGTFDFTVGVTDSNHCAGSASYSIMISCPAITLSPGVLPDPNIGVAYSQSVTASGGSPAYAYTVNSGALPSGLTLAANGLISGTPTVTGFFSVTIKATDANNCTGVKAYTLHVSPADCTPILITSVVLPNAVIAVPYSYGYAASEGTPPFTYVVSGGSLPAGLTLSSSGAVTGTPAALGKSVFTVTVMDDSSCIGTRADSITVVCPAITFTPASLDTAIIGVGYSKSVSASGGKPPYAYGVTAGALPAGLSLSSGGSISGTPTAFSTGPFTITATDSSGCTGAKAYSIVVVCPALTMLPAIFPGGTVGSLYHQTLSGSGGRSPYSFALSSGSLPSGLTLSPAGVLSGTPAAVETLAFTVSVTDSFGCQGTAARSIAIGPQVLTTVSVPLAGRWNMISLPVTVQDSAVGSVYPGAASSAFAFSSSGSYVVRSFLQPGPGYWLKFGSAHTQSVTGGIIVSDTIPVSAGWNMIGSVTQSIPVSQLTSIPGGMVTSQFFEYTGSYMATTTLVPGQGYWVKVNQPGSLIMSSTAAAPSANIVIVPGHELPPALPDQGSESQVPREFALQQNFPNPFNPTTEIRFDIADAGFVTLRIYDVLGREIASLVGEEMTPGVYSVVWDATRSASGVYYCRLQEGNLTEVRKMHLVR